MTASTKRTPGRLVMTMVLAVFMLGILAPAAVAKPVAPAPDIAAISPTSGLRGSTVTVSGRDFGGPKTKVWVGSVAARVTSSTGNRAVFQVPATAPLGPTTVRLTNPSGQSDAVPFTVLVDGQIQPVLDPGRSGVSSIGPAGGSVSATGADGSGYRLEIPAGALDATQLITLTPVISIVDLPLSGGLRAAAHFEPSGLVLGRPASLTITLAGAVPPLVAFAYGGAGSDFAVVASTIGTSTVTIPIEHFSGAGAGTPSAADFDALVAPIIASLGPLTYSQVTGLGQLMVDWERLFGEDFCETRPSCGAAMQRVQDSLVTLAGTACTTGQANLGTAPALAGARDAVRLLTNYEAAWDRLRLVDQALGAGTIAPDTIPIEVADQSSAQGCRATTMGRVITRATVLAQAEPFATSEVGSAPGEDDVTNLGWLYVVGADAGLLTLEDLAQQALWAGESIIGLLVFGDPNAPGSGAATKAEEEPFDDAPAAAQEPYVLARSDADHDQRSSNWEWLWFLGIQAQELGVGAGDSVPAYLEAALSKIIEEGNAGCLTEEAAGRADLEHGRTYALVLPLLVAEFDDALAACGVRITISPAESSVQVGGQVQYNATVTGTSDTAVTWSSPDAATPTAGLFMAPPTPGTYHVVAAVTEHPTRKATAVVTVSDEVLISVTPGYPGTVAVGGTVQFSASVTGGETNTVSWSATGGTVTQSGLFTGTTVGLASATATSVDDTTVSSTVIFEVGGSGISISPASTTVTVGRKRQFEAVVAGGTGPVRWSSSCGSITSTGLFSAPSALRPCTVTATSDELGASATAIVTLEPGVRLANDSASRVQSGAVAFYSDDCTQGEEPVTVYTFNGSGTQTCSMTVVVPELEGERTVTGTAAGSWTWTMDITDDGYITRMAGSVTADASISDVFEWRTNAHAIGYLEFNVLGGPCDVVLAGGVDATTARATPDPSQYTAWVKFAIGGQDAGVRSESEGPEPVAIDTALPAGRYALEVGALTSALSGYGYGEGAQTGHSTADVVMTFDCSGDAAGG